VKVAKFLLRNILIISLLLFLSFSIVNAEDEISVEIAGNKITFEDQTPLIKNGRTLVPMRKIFETLGMTVKWDETTQKITGEKENKKIELFINSNTARIDNTYKTVEVPPQIINGRTMVPIRFISEELGLDVKWNENIKNITIKDRDKEIGELYYDSGKLRYRGELKNNKENGFGMWYYETGAICFEGYFKDGSPNGYVKFYGEDGKLKTEGNNIDYKNGKIYGNVIQYYENSNKAYEGEYKNSIMDGKGKAYDTNGVLVFDGYFENGIQNGSGKLYKTDGSLLFEGIWKNGETNGFGKSYNEKGNVVFEGIWKDGKQNGLGKLYNETGEAVIEGIWKDGKFVGNNNVINSNDDEDEKEEEDVEEEYKNTELKGIESIEDFKDYLSKKYDEIETPMGDIKLTHTINKNSSSIFPHDYEIHTDWKNFSPFDLEYSIEYSDKEKEKTKEILKETQTKIAEDSFEIFPNKKITGGYYHGYYKYPYSRVGYESIRFLTWVNYVSIKEDNANGLMLGYDDVKISKFRWRYIIDDYDFTN